MAYRIARAAPAWRPPPTRTSAGRAVTAVPVPSSHSRDRAPPRGWSSRRAALSDECEHEQRGRQREPGDEQAIGDHQRAPAADQEHARTQSLGHPSSIDRRLSAVAEPAARTMAPPASPASVADSRDRACRTWSSKTDLTRRAKPAAHSESPLEQDGRLATCRGVVSVHCDNRLHRPRRTPLPQTLGDPAGLPQRLAPAQWRSRHEW